MSIQVTLTIPDNVYRQVEDIAKSSNRPITEVLADTILSAFPPLYVNKDRWAMQHEVAAFEATHSQLWQQYPYQYVATHQGIVVDHDVDELALVERIDEQYPETVVLIRQVLPELPQILTFRSPRLVKSS
jgi:hypothetical protein